VGEGRIRLRISAEKEQMIRRALLALLLLLPLVTLAQKPVWVTDRSLYPNTHFLVGYAENIGTETPEFIAELKASAKSALIESISVSVTSLRELYKSESKGVYSEEYVSATSSFADADINGLTIDYYYDKASNRGYAVAHAAKNDVKGYYTANIAVIIQKIEAGIDNARQAETDGQRGRAKRTYEELAPLFAELERAQSFLMAIEGGEPEEAQIRKTLTLQQTITQAIARLQTAIIVYITSVESNLGHPVQILEPKLKAELSEHGCSFIPEQTETDWVLSVETSTRRGDSVNDICFSYLDAKVSLVEGATGKEIYGNTFTNIKGGALSFTQAGIKAYETVSTLIADEIVKKLER
jgi:hypothetical protein